MPEVKEAGALNRRSSRARISVPRSLREAAADGVIKFNLDWVEGDVPDLVQDLIFWRNRLYEARLIGANSDGVGYGNISKRYGRGFIISGSGTGNRPVATAAEFTWVRDYDFKSNFVSCLGPVKASSESLTHAAVYEASESVQAVVHGHHGRVWRSMYGKVLMTSPDAAYGTPHLAKEIFRLFRSTNLESAQFFVMAGHQDGLVSFGPTLKIASLRMLEML